MWKDKIQYILLETRKMLNIREKQSITGTNNVELC